MRHAGKTNGATPMMDEKISTESWVVAAAALLVKETAVKLLAGRWR